MRMIFRLVVLIAVVAIGAWLLGFWSPADVMTGRWGNWGSATGGTGTVNGTAGDRLKQFDNQAVRAARKVETFTQEAGLSGKIKSKMALDDVVRARSIGVSTTGTVVTLTGTVRSVAERDQALKLARDTKGVTQVLNHLVVVP